MRRAIALLCLLLLVPGWAAAQTVAPDWDAATLAQFSRIPIQDGGRVKPLSTYAIFELVQISGRMQIDTPEGRRVGALHWLLDCLFYPDRGRQYQAVLIENPQVMQAIGLDDSKKRARFRLVDLEPHADRLLDLARSISAIDEAQRNPLQRQILALYSAYAGYQSLVHAMDFARFAETVPAGSPLAERLAAIGLEPTEDDGASRFRYADLLVRLPAIVTAYRADVGDKPVAEATNADSPLLPLLMRLDLAAQNSTALTILPPDDDQLHEAWLSPGTLLEDVLTHDALPVQNLRETAALQDLADRVAAGGALDRGVAVVVGTLSGAAIARDEYPHIGLEIFYYRLRPFYWSLVLFVLGAVLVAVSWMAPRNRWLGRAAVVAVVVPTALLVIGIALRCTIRGRPPVTTLYETTLFIPAVAVVVALIAEWINRRRIALSVAAGFGCLGLFLAHNYELRGPDTMESMVAVLDSNFWLSTHVTSVTIGYSAGLLAAALAHLFILGRAFGLGRDRTAFYRSVARLIYGVICFGTLFAFVGTVLGGIWANNSWGRFWGWDPKENGALLIILWFLFILHARLGGYIRELGTAVCAVIGGMIVAFSWWGVNLLQVGLHSYGFLSGVQQFLYGFWGLELGVLMMGAVAAWQLRRQREAVIAAGGPPQPFTTPATTEAQPGK